MRIEAGLIKVNIDEETGKSSATDGLNFKIEYPTLDLLKEALYVILRKSREEGYVSEEDVKRSESRIGILGVRYATTQEFK